ncbi:hypothetical protein [Candidatus Lokiarchaeum ossiferum]|uniref:hypothetical protein n=1 Tax=Candidatus Lokiarchaeum ossiferum TaxID=2951803 RepID=UPI00352DA82F
MIAMKDVNVTISLHTFRRVVKMPRIMSLRDEAHIIDIIATLDQEFHEKTKEDGKPHTMDFQDKKVISLLQMLWNPIKKQFYSDVGIEARTPFPDLKALPVDTDWKFSLPNNANLILTPDPMC